MDNIFEILIYLFIIVSFLSSLFRKKEKPEVKKGRKIPKPPVDLQTQAKTPQQEEYDILKEIEKMFKTETSYPEKQEELSFEKHQEKFEPVSEHVETTDWHQKVSEEHKTSISEHSFTDWETKKQKAEEARKAVNEKIAKQAEIFEKQLARRNEEIISIRKNIIQKIKNPKSLKEYIIFSEILGKPKAISGGYFGEE